jgi:hypothetical protein
MENKGMGSGERKRETDYLSIEDRRGGIEAHAGRALAPKCSLSGLQIR